MTDYTEVRLAFIINFINEYNTRLNALHGNVACVPMTNESGLVIDYYNANVLILRLLIKNVSIITGELLNERVKLSSWVDHATGTDRVWQQTGTMTRGDEKYMYLCDYLSFTPNESDISA